MGLGRRDEQTNCRARGTVMNSLLRRTFPRNRWCSADLRALTDLVPGFAENLLRQGTRYIHVLGIAHLNAAALPEALAERALFSMKRSSKEILNSSVGPCPALLVTLEKLEPVLLPKNHYEWLLSALRDPLSNKVFRHLKTVTRRQLWIAEHTPSEYHNSRIMKLVRDNAEAHDIVSSIAMAERIVGSGGRPELATSFRSIQAIDGVDDWLNRWKRQVIFPEPPWVGTNELTPVRNAKDLHRLAREFRNCAWIHLDHISRGDVALYTWYSEGTRAMVSVERLPHNGWRVLEIKGVANKLLDRRSLIRFQESIRDYENLDTTNLAQLVRQRGNIRGTRYYF